jgi:hypothetical protein
MAKLAPRSFRNERLINVARGCSREVLAHELVHHAHVKLLPSAEDGRNAAEIAMGSSAICRFVRSGRNDATCPGPVEGGRRSWLGAVALPKGRVR